MSDHSQENENVDIEMQETQPLSAKQSSEFVMKKVLESDAKLMDDVDLDSEESKYSEAPIEIQKSKMLISAASSKVVKSSKYTVVQLRDPRKFSESGYKLDCLSGVKILIAITMYNESRDLLALTLRGVCDNIRALMIRTDNPYAWEDVAVLIISDGRAKANEETLEFLHELRLFSKSQVEATLAKSDPKSIGCHVWEGVSVFLDNPDIQSEFPPLKTVFALKEHNAGKLDSHWWLLRAFATPECAPDAEFVFLVDVGTRPRRKAFYHMYRAFKRNEDIAGTCGEIMTRNMLNFNPVVAAQHFEYKIAGILDKSLESVLGYVTVLPGAFSAYRLVALQGRPLSEYFRFLESEAEMTPFLANMYLAEDRILGFELFAKSDEKWSLHYVADAVADTDVPSSYTDLIKQRRRWINGSFFALLYALGGFWRVFFSSSHTVERKFLSFLELIYLVVQLIFSWLLPATFFLALYFSFRWVTDDSLWATIAFPAVFVFLILFSLYLSLNCKPNEYSIAYGFVSILFGVLFTFVSGLTIAFVIIDFVEAANNFSYETFFAIIAALSVVLMYVIIAVIRGEVASLAASFSQYWLLLPSFSLLFPLFSMANLHDVSWGTKNIESASHGAVSRQSMFEIFRTMFLSFWILTNTSIAVFFAVLGDYYVGGRTFTQWFLVSLFIASLAITGCKFLGSLVFSIARSITKSAEKKDEKAERKRIREVLREQGILVEPHPDDSCVSSLPFLIQFWLVFFRPSRWFSFGITVFSVTYSLATFIWTAGTAVIAIPLMFVFPIGTVVTAMAGCSWLALASAEFDLFSRDGSIAAWLKQDSASLGRESTGYPPINTGLNNVKTFADFFNWQRQVLLDGATWKAAWFFVVIKPIIALISAFFLGLFAFGIIFILQPFLADACADDNTTFACIQFNSAMDSLRNSSSGLASVIESPYFGFITVPIGIFLAALAMTLVHKFAGSARAITSVSLGEELNDLEFLRALVPVENADKGKQANADEGERSPLKGENPRRSQAEA